MKKTIAGIMILYLLQANNLKAQDIMLREQGKEKTEKTATIKDTTRLRLSNNEYLKGINYYEPKNNEQGKEKNETKKEGGLEEITKINEKTTLETNNYQNEYSFSFTPKLRKGSIIKKAGLEILKLVGLVKLEYHYGPEKELELKTPLLTYKTWMEGEIYKEKINDEIKETKSKGEDLFTQAHKILTEPYDFLQEKDRTVKVIYDGAIRTITIHSEKITEEYLKLSTNLEHLGKNNQIKEISAKMKINEDKTLTPEEIKIEIKDEIYEVRIK